MKERSKNETNNFGYSTLNVVFATGHHFFVQFFIGITIVKKILLIILLYSSGLNMMEVISTKSNG